ncbi:hypothetical protein [Clostridium perfringens]|uniref:hypothetical protein n=1 Tax=Clostridium perfringens TaxID=1502 RepID=UPI000D71267F|nr:hypothetical protein [Clostridium perfringens]PWW92634.1 hypothetical protein CYK76_00080 [Clostridium perfringens]PWX73104.1 hypothetical protein CYK77_04280 [Clostridium perfringens]
MCSNLSGNFKGKVNLEMKNKVLKMINNLEIKVLDYERNNPCSYSNEFKSDLIKNLNEILNLGSFEPLISKLLNGEVKEEKYLLTLSKRQQYSFNRAVTCLIVGEISIFLRALTEFLENDGAFKEQSDFSIYEKSIVSALINNMIFYLKCIL